MKKHKIDFKEELANRPDSEKPPLKVATFYLSAMMVCPDCDHEEVVRINLDKEVYHDCNEGHVRTTVPSFPLAPSRRVDTLLIKKENK